MTRGHAGPRFLTTLPYTRRPAWTARADIVDPASLPAARLVERLVRSAGRYDALVLNGSHRADQVAAAVIARRRRPPAVVLVDATWKTGDGLQGRLRRTSVRSLDHAAAHYCVLSEDEARVFPPNWGIDAARVHVTPFHWVLDESEVAEVPAADGSVFAGGDSLRDYRALAEAARGLPVPVTIASRAPAPPGLPGNVTMGALDAAEYAERFRTASVVVVALERRDDRSAGQQTYLNAMALGKPVIVTDSLGVHEYVEDGRTGLVVPPGDARALRAALDQTLDPANADEVAALGERARAAALERFGPDRYVENLLQVVDRALAARE